MFRKVLLPVDLDAAASWKKSVEIASDLAASGAEIHVLAVLPELRFSILGSYFDKDFEGAALKDMTGGLRRWMAEHMPAGIKAVPHVAHGTVYDEIIRTADRLKCDVIVVGASRPDARQYLLGPNAARVVRHAKQTVVVARD
ncbi:universal stress protein [Limibaculum sp. M0105]|uniref:Universal stress protein n=1 Tax=Thermohalobaculum xanthum TaxID=2753746 RepID=A0A8J7M7E9_9RHOB|nr:universal stress protein [Thermohalobaculum xanthum]MBK0399971.1 universal stress protein [Thermohalobaculum xanthum]